MASNKGRPRFAQMTRYMLDDSMLQASAEYTGKDFSKVVNAMVRSIESQIAEKIKVDITNINGVRKASFIAPTLKKNEILKVMEATRGALPKALNSYTDSAKEPVSYGISFADLESVYLKKTIKGKKARTRLESNVAKMKGDVKYTDEPEIAYVRLLKDPATASETTDRYLKEKASIGVGALNREEQQARDKQRQAEEDKKRKEEEKAKAKKEAKKEQDKKESASKRMLLGRIVLLVTLLKGLRNITKRILTTAMRFAVAERARQTQEHDLNVERGQYLKNQYVSQSMGLDKNALNTAIQSVQDKFGNITELDEKSVERLALVMGEGVKDLITSGMGGDNPQALTEQILNSFYQKIMRGENSVSERVGQASARRELVSYLQKIDPQLSKMLSAMLELNSSGALAGKINEWSDVVNALTPKERFGIDETDLNAVSAFAQQLNVAKTSLASFSNALTAWATKHFGGALDVVNDLTGGMSDADKARKRIEDAKTREGRMGQLSARAGESKTAMSQRLASLGIDTTLWTDEDFTSMSSYLTGKGDAKGIVKKDKNLKGKLDAYKLLVTSGGDMSLLSEAVNYASTSEMLEALGKQKKGYKEVTFGDEMLNVKIKEKAVQAEKNLFRRYMQGSEDYDIYYKDFKDLNRSLLPTVHAGLGNLLAGQGVNAKVFKGTFGKGAKYSSAEEVLNAYKEGTLDPETMSLLQSNFWYRLQKGDAGAKQAMALAFEERFSGKKVSSTSLFRQELTEEGVPSWVERESEKLRSAGNTVYSYSATPSFNEKTGTSNLHVVIEGIDAEGKERTLFSGNIDMGGNWTSKQISEMQGVSVDLSNTTK